ncbi:ABC transporter permease [Lacticaseibacillus rhamnosus 2166]|nr:ABC transporter permease [Lacticaseibacillus rhamnosus 2166]
MQEVTTLTQEPKKRVKPSVNWLKILPWLVPLAFLMSWQAAVSFNWVTSSLIPAPSTVIQDGISLWQSGELPKNIAISLYRATAGFAIGGSVGFALGLINGLVKPIRALLDSPIQMLRNIPHLSLIPLMIILMGIGEPAKIALVASGLCSRCISTRIKALSAQIRSYWKWAVLMAYPDAHCSPALFSRVP